MCIAALVVGIVSVICGLFVNGWLGLILGIIGVVLSILGGKSQPEQKTMATAGFVLSVIGIVLGLILAIFCGCLSCIVCSSAAASRL